MAMVAKVGSAPGATDASAASPVARRAALAGAVAIGVVLRVVGIGSTTASFDEAFTGSVAAAPLTDIPDILRRTDAHPPLDYLVRHVVAGSHDTAWLRAPSALIAIVTLLVVAWWMWGRGWFGVVAVAFTAINPFAIHHAHQARMYTLLILAGTVAAVASERWLVDGRRRWIGVVGGAVLVASFTHVTGFLLAGAVFLVPLARRDRDAWWWRAAAVAPAVLFVVVWAPFWGDQLARGPAKWIPLTSPEQIALSIGGTVRNYETAGAEIVTLAIIAGTVALVLARGPLARVALVLGGLPVAVAVVAGFWTHILLPRSLSVAAWLPPLALAALTRLAYRRWPPLGVVTGAVVAAFMVTAIGPTLAFEDASAPARAALVGAVAPGDAVVIVPDWLAPFGTWDLALPDAPRVPAGLETVASSPAWVQVMPGAPFTGRVWMLDPDPYPPKLDGLEACADTSRDRHEGGFALRCLQVAATP